MGSTASIPGWYIEFQTALLRQAPRPGEIDQQTAEFWTSNQKRLKGYLLTRLLKRFDEIDEIKLVETQVLFLHLISGGKKITISACKGKRTIAKAGSLFTGYIDPNFVNYGLDVEGVATPDTDVEVHELVCDGQLTDIYNSVGTDLNKLCLTQDQIISFVETHEKWLRTNGYGTFFLMKKGNNFFVAGVALGPSGWGTGVRRRSDGCVWGGDDGYRFVFRQLTAPVAT